MKILKYLKEILPWGRVADKIFAGATVKEFGVLREERHAFGGYIKQTVLLAQRNGIFKLYIRSRYGSWFGSGIQYQAFDEEAMKKLAAVLEEANVLVDKDRQITDLREQVAALQKQLEVARGRSEAGA